MNVLAINLINDTIFNDAKCTKQYTMLNAIGIPMMTIPNAVSQYSFTVSITHYISL